MDIYTLAGSPDHKGTKWYRAEVFKEGVSYSRAWDVSPEVVLSWLSRQYPDARYIIIRPPPVEVAKPDQGSAGGDRWRACSTHKTLIGIRFTLLVLFCWYVAREFVIE